MTDQKMPAVPKGAGSHVIGWLELTTTDHARFKKFYGEVFGWTFKPFRDDYFFYETPKGLAGGVRVSPPAGSPPQAFYIHTPDIDATLARIATSGGSRLVEKEKIGDWGHVAFFKDPSGVIVGLSDMLVPNDYHPSPLASQAGLVPHTFAAIEIHGTDLAKTRAFYTDLFGWSCVETMPSYMGFDTGAGVGGVFQSHTPATHVVTYVWVDDVKATLARVVAAGGTPQGEPMAMPGMPVFGYFTDPAGNAFGLMGAR